MTERPILFSAPMVRAILDGRKTQTRRIIQPQPPQGYQLREFVLDPTLSARFENDHEPLGMWTKRCPYGASGDRLWVRETFCIGYDHEGRGKNYSALPWTGADPQRDGKPFYAASFPEKEDEPRMPWRPSIHMPRWASRSTLEIVSVRVERLQAITEEDARAEGAMYHDGHGVGHSGWRHDFKDVHADARSSFARLWQEINAKRAPWESNPWVWVIEFRRLP